MIPRILSILLTPLDYLAAAYLVARGRWVAFKRAPIAKAEAQARDVAQGFADGLAAGSSPTCDGCGAGVGEERRPGCRFDAPPVACCYCGKPQEDPTAKIAPDFGREWAPHLPLCLACFSTVPAPRIWAKLAAASAQAAVAARAEEAGGPGKALGQDAEPEYNHATGRWAGVLYPCGNCGEVHVGNGCAS